MKREIHGSTDVTSHFIEQACVLATATVWHVERYLKMLDFFKRREKFSCLLKKYAKIGKFSYIQIVLKSSMLDVVKECIWYLFFRKDSMKVNVDLNPIV